MVIRLGHGPQTRPEMVESSKGKGKKARPRKTMPQKLSASCEDGCKELTARGMNYKVKVRACLVYGYETKVGQRGWAIYDLDTCPHEK